MAQQTYTGNGPDSNYPLRYPFSFPSIQSSDIRVTVNNTDKTLTNDYTLNNYSSAGSATAYIEFVSSTARATGTVRIFRRTDGNDLTRTFQAGSAIKADDLNTANKQTLFLAEENRDSINGLAAGDASSPISINGSNIANNSITTNKILDLEVGTSDLANLAVTTGKIADDAVTTDKLANSINTTIAGKANTGANLSTFTNDSNFINLTQAAGVFTTGMIMMFTGSSAPSGWAFCDGNNGTPDLRNRFIVGAGSSYSSGDTGGANDVILTATQMPNHAHYFSGSQSHSHSFRGVGGNDHNDSERNAVVMRNDSNTMYTASSPSGVQSTTVTISGNTGNNGSGGAHENRPPYYALAYIMKT